MLHFRLLNLRSVPEKWIGFRGTFHVQAVTDKKWDMNTIQAFWQAKKQNISNVLERIIFLQAQNNIK